MQKGQTLIEALIALAVAAIVISAAVLLTRDSLSNSQTSKDQNIATQLAQEGLELARQIRQAPTVETSYCTPSGATSLGAVGVCSSASPLINDIYRRQVTLSPVSSISTSSCGTTSYQVKSVVSWTDGKCRDTAFCRNVELVSCIAP